MESGKGGDTIVRLTDGSIGEQVEYNYEYRYAYRAKVLVAGDRMHVDEMRKTIRVRRLS